MGTQGGATLAVQFRLDEGSVHHVRLMVHSFALLLSRDRGLAGRLTVASAELVQLIPETVFGCTLGIEVASSGRATVTVSSEVSAQAEAKLVAATREVNTGTPLDAYSRALQAAPGASVETLPLARVRYEAQMELSVKRSGSQLSIVAQGL